MERGFLITLRYLLLGLCAVVVLATAYLVGLSNGRSERQAIAEAAYQQAWDEAKAALDASGLLPQEPTQLLAVSGIIDEIAGDTLIISSDAVTINPLVPPGPDSRTVTITSNTKILASTSKPEEEITRAEDEFMRAQEANPEALLEPPLLYTETEIGPSELSIGDRVIIESATDIKYAIEITATRVIRF